MFLTRKTEKKNDITILAHPLSMYFFQNVKKYNGKEEGSYTRNKKIKKKLEKAGSALYGENHLHMMRFFQ